MENLMQTIMTVVRSIIEGLDIRFLDILFAPVIVFLSRSRNKAKKNANSTNDFYTTGSVKKDDLVALIEYHRRCVERLSVRLQEEEKKELQHVDLHIGAK